MKIVFMGTPDFAVASLESLVQSPHEVAAVVTAPDKPAGRGRKPKSSAVKKAAEHHGLQVLQPQNLKSSDFQEQLQQLQPQLFVVVAFRMLPRSVWEIPEKGTINLHASLLPRYRGAAPINWAVVNGERETGVTTFFINENIDTGSLIFQEKVPINEKDTAGHLHDKLMEKGAKLMVKTVDAIAQGTAPRQAQQAEEPLQKAPKIEKEHLKIDFARPVREVYNHIRGMAPYPGAYAYLHQGGEKWRAKILQAGFEENDHEKAAGTLLTDNQSYLKIACQSGFIEVHEIQIEGKKRMPTGAFLNGFELLEGAFFA